MSIVNDLATYVVDNYRGIVSKRLVGTCFYRKDEFTQCYYKITSMISCNIKDLGLTMVKVTCYEKGINGSEAMTIRMTDTRVKTFNEMEEIHESVLMEGVQPVINAINMTAIQNLNSKM